MTNLHPLRHSLGMAGALLLFACSMGAAQPIPAWDDFAIVIENNVFDPTRTVARRPILPVRPRPAPAPPAPQREHLDLHGLLLEGSEVTVFLSSSRAEWTGTVTVAAGDVVGPGRILGFSSSALDLQVGNERTRWSIGTRLESADGVWAVAGAAKAAPALAGTASTGLSGTSSTPSPGGGSWDRAAVMRRIMERRKEESAE